MNTFLPLIAALVRFGLFALLLVLSKSYADNGEHVACAILFVAAIFYSHFCLIEKS